MRTRDSKENTASPGGAQLGFFFEEPVVDGTITRPEKPTLPERAASVQDNESEKGSMRRKPRVVEGSTLPAWARATMPGKPAGPTEPQGELEAEPEPRVWRVAELVSDVRRHTEDAYGDLRVRGEISNLRAAPSGHLYFTLKDGEAALPAVMFRKEALKLRFRPEDGLEVLLGGRASVYEQRGQLQLVAETLEPVGAGSLQVAFEQLKKKLEAEGLFAMDRKRPLPLYPRCVGIVTSPAGAVIRDFLNVAGRRHAALDVLLYPAVVQGEAAAREIAAGLAYFNRLRSVDVIVVARGGGSLEDLQPFNSEMVARAIADSTLPVVSAVGHETDFTIADFVADLRAPTPSAAAELITAAQHRVEEHVEQLCARLTRGSRWMVAMARQRFAGLGAEASFARWRGSLQRREQRADELRFRLERAGVASMGQARERVERVSARLLRQDATHRVCVMRERLEALQLRLENAAGQRWLASRKRHEGAAGALGRYDATQCLLRMDRTVDELRGRLERAAAARLRGARHRREAAARGLETLSPLAVLRRGYAVVFAEDGSVVTRAGDAGEQIRVRLREGELAAQVIGRTIEGA